MGCFNCPLWDICIGIHCMRDEDECEEERRSSNLESWERAVKEVRHYLAQEGDYFTVSVGPWTITYDVNESEEK